MKKKNKYKRNVPMDPESYKVYLKQHLDELLSQALSAQSSVGGSSVNNQGAPPQSSVVSKKEELEIKNLEAD